MKGNPIVEYIIFVTFWALLWFPLKALNSPEEKLLIQNTSNVAQEDAVSEIEVWLELKATDEIKLLKVNYQGEELLHLSSEKEDYHSFTLAEPTIGDEFKFNVELEFENQTDELRAVQFKFNVGSFETQAFDYWIRENSFSKTILLELAEEKL